MILLAWNKGKHETSSHGLRHRGRAGRRKGTATSTALVLKQRTHSSHPKPAAGHEQQRIPRGKGGSENWKIPMEELVLIPLEVWMCRKNVRPPIPQPPTSPAQLATPLNSRTSTQRQITARASPKPSFTDIKAVT
ncbi:hypothetical protein L3X38_017574 [Prunus dulcis]|uniref:Uncharacterized protein n=1 Tax=Prunus dulcis TaxID=3755 RepID=A0AAD4ZAU9_PRUDU|nr:hypothetical protein L3X38_017574 [Prunus dulcis]